MEVSDAEQVKSMAKGLYDWMRDGGLARSQIPYGTSIPDMLMKASTQAAELDALRSKNAELETECEKAAKELIRTNEFVCMQSGEIFAHEATIAQLRDRVAGLEEGLRPFARAAKWWKAFDNTQRITSLHQYGDCLEVLHLRKAHALLSQNEVG